MIRLRPVFAAAWKLLQWHSTFWILGVLLSLGLIFSVGMNITPDLLSPATFAGTTEGGNVVRYLSDYSQSNPQIIRITLASATIGAVILFLVSIIARAAIAVLLVTQTHHEAHALRRSLRAGTEIVWRGLLVYVIGSALQSVLFFVFLKPLEYLFGYGYGLIGYGVLPIALGFGLLSYVVLVASVRFLFFYFAIFSKPLGKSLSYAYRLTIANLGLIVRFALRIVLIVLIEVLVQAVLAFLVGVMFWLLWFALSPFLAMDVYAFSLILAGVAVWVVVSFVAHGLFLAYIEIAWYWLFRLAEDAFHTQGHTPDTQ